ncbi:MAG: M1 family peptidase, partial [Oceanihabitans sp.]|nr:M1 family peptidase [Oceanihabitans sp.]
MKRILFLLFILISTAIHAQQTDIVDFKKLDAVVFFNQIKIDSTLYDSLELRFDILKKTDSIYLDAVGMQFKNIALNGKKVKFKNDGKKLIIYSKFRPSEGNKLQFLFFASPKKAMYFVGWNDEARNQIWT